MIPIRYTILLLLFIANGNLFSQNCGISVRRTPHFDTIYKNEEIYLSFRITDSSRVFQRQFRISDTADFSTYISSYYGNSLVNVVLSPRRTGACRSPSFCFYTKDDSCKINSRAVFVHNADAGDQLIYKRYNPGAFKKDSLIAARKKEFQQNKNVLLDSVKRILCTAQKLELITDTSVYRIKKKKTAAMVIRYYADVPCLYKEQQSTPDSKPSALKAGSFTAFPYEGTRTYINVPSENFIFPEVSNSKKVKFYSFSVMKLESLFPEITEEPLIETLQKTYKVLYIIEFSVSFEKKGVYKFDPAAIQTDLGKIYSNSFTVIVE